MYPIILNLGFIKIYTYGLIMASAFLISIYLFLHEGKKLGLKEKFLTDFAFYMILSSIIGARLLYVFMNFHSYIQNPLLIFKLWEGGMVFYGGILVALPVSIYLIKRKTNSNLLQFADLLAPILVLGHAIGRIGCFFSGCCYGIATNSFLGVIFTRIDSLGPLGLKIHPTQLYEAFGNILIFLFLWTLRTRKKFNGQIIALYLIIYPIFRFFLEFLRGDDRGRFAMLSITQFLSVILLILGAITFYYAQKNRN